MKEPTELAVRTRDFHHFLPDPQPLVLPSDPKLAKKYLSLERKRIKTAKEERMIVAAKDIFVEIVRESIKGGMEVLSSGLRAAGQVGRGIAENPDPVSQGVAVGGGFLLLQWFIQAYPDAAKLTGLDQLAAMKVANNITRPFIPVGGDSKPPVISGINGNIPSSQPKPNAVSYWYLWRFRPFFNWQQIFYTKVDDAIHDFDLWNAIGTAGNVVQTTVDFVDHQDFIGPLPPGQPRPTFTGFWFPVTTVTVIKTSTAHSDVGPVPPA